MSRGYQNQATRVEIESTRYENGQLLVTARGMAGERFEDLPWRDGHGFHSRPHKGSVGMLSAPGGRRDQGFVMAAVDTSKVPALGEGDAVLYDMNGNILKLFAGGAVFDLAGRTATFTAGGWTINGPVTINGDVTVNGNLQASGSVTDGDGDGGA
jgi:phage gp45-like